MEKKEGIVFVIENHKTWQWKILLHDCSMNQVPKILHM
jgi:hypothetical protein